MYQLPLLSNRFKKAGMTLFLIGLALGVIYIITEMQPSFLEYKFGGESSDSFNNFLFKSQGNFIDELFVLFIIIGGCLWGFSKEKEEDEYLGLIRLNALIWAFLINYFLIILCTIFIYSFWYLNVMMYNLVTPLIIFLIRYNYLLNKLRKA